MRRTKTRETRRRPLILGLAAVAFLFQASKLVHPGAEPPASPGPLVTLTVSPPPDVKLKPNEVVVPSTGGRRDRPVPQVTLTRRPPPGTELQPNEVLDLPEGD